MKAAELIFILLPAAGHLVSLVQLAKLLVSRDEDLSIRILIFKLSFLADFDFQSLLAETTKGIQFIELPQPESQADPFESKNHFSLLSKLIDGHKSGVRDFVAQLKESGSSRVAGFVVDACCTAMIDVANEFEVPTYAFYTSGAAVLGLRLDMETLIYDKNQDVLQYKDSEVEVPLSTYTNPVPAKLFPSSIFDKDGVILKQTRRLIGETKGIMINTFLDLESYAIKALESKEKMPPVYPIGPLINFTGVKSNRLATDTIMRWLNDQPNSSVIFLCFGSFGSFEVDQVKEIAHAIEDSGCRFLWSLRRPPPKGRLEYPSEYENPKDALPEGFLERTAGTGKVIGWAPQAQVLSHPAVGGFVTHCGWNSVLESVWFGVPMAVWPIYAEQQMNAFLIVKDLGIAAEIKMDYKKDIVNGTEIIVKADEIETGIRQLMQPENGIRKKVKKLMENARTASVEGGSSYTSLGSLIEDFSLFPLEVCYGSKVKAVPADEWN